MREDILNAASPHVGRTQFQSKDNAVNEVNLALSKTAYFPHFGSWLLETSIYLKG